MCKHFKPVYWIYSTNLFLLGLYDFVFDVRILTKLNKVYNSRFYQIGTPSIKQHDVSKALLSQQQVHALGLQLYLWNGVLESIQTIEVQ